MNKSRMVVLLIVTMAIWGGTFVVGRVMSQSIEPMALAFWRFVVASVVLFVLMLRRDGKIAVPQGKAWLWAASLGLTGVAAYNLFFFAGLKIIPSSRAALLVALNPIMVAVFGAIFLRQRLSVIRWLGVLLSLFGAVTVISHAEYSKMLADGIGHGEWLILGCCFSWVAYTLFGKGAVASLGSLPATAWASVIGCVVLGVVATFSGVDLNPIAITPPQWGGIVYLGALATAAGFVWYNNGIRDLGAARTIVFTNFVPVFAVLSSVLFLGEQLSWPTIFGGLLVIAGVTLTNVQGR
ncbi:DMT family transporter [Burkholderiaceae bacterium DAT-1]|nr:DMT family transporter [Burkholderiaceae bacterium DAT-1]